MSDVETVETNRQIDSTIDAVALPCLRSGDCIVRVNRIRDQFYYIYCPRLLLSERFVGPLPLLWV